MNFIIGSVVGLAAGYGIAYWIANSRGIPGAVSYTNPVFNNNASTYPPGYQPPATLPPGAVYVAVMPWGTQLNVASVPQQSMAMPS